MRALLVVLFLGQFITFGTQNVVAEVPICPAVYPCDGRGNVLAPFDKGECKDVFEAMCLAGYVSDLEEQISEMHDTVDEQASEIKTLRKRNQRLKKKVRRRGR